MVTERVERSRHSEVISPNGDKGSGSTTINAANAASASITGSKLSSFFLPRSKRAHFRVRINIVELINVPLVNGKLFVAWKFKGSHDNTWVPRPLTHAERGGQRNGTDGSKGSGSKSDRPSREDEDVDGDDDRNSEILVEEPQQFEDNHSSYRSGDSHPDLKSHLSSHNNHRRTESGFTSMNSSRYASQTSLTPTESPESGETPQNGNSHLTDRARNKNKSNQRESFSSSQDAHKGGESSNGKVYQTNDGRSRSHSALSVPSNGQHSQDSSEGTPVPPSSPSKISPAKARIQGMFSQRRSSSSSQNSMPSSPSHSSNESGTDGHLALKKMQSRSVPALHRGDSYKAGQSINASSQSSLVSQRQASLTSRLFNLRSSSSSMQTLSPEKQNATCEDLSRLDDEAYTKMMHGPATGGKGRTPNHGISSSGVKWRYVVENKVMIPISNKGALLPYEFRVDVYHEIRPDVQKQIQQDREEHMLGHDNDEKSRDGHQNTDDHKKEAQARGQHKKPNKGASTSDVGESKKKAKATSDEKEVHMIGTLRLDLAAYAGKEAEDMGVREKGLVRRYLLRDSKINSMLKLSIRVEQLDGPTDYAAPSLPKQHLFGSLKDFITERPNWLAFDSGMEKHVRKLEAKRDKMYGTQLGLQPSKDSSGGAVNTTGFLANMRAQLKEGRLVFSGPDRIAEQQNKDLGLADKVNGEQTEDHKSESHVKTDSTSGDGYGRSTVPGESRDAMSDSRSPSGGGASIASRTSRRDHTRNNSFSPYAPLSTTSGENRQYFRDLNSNKERDKSGMGGSRKDGSNGRSVEEIIEELFNAPDETYLQKAFGTTWPFLENLRRKETPDDKQEQAAANDNNASKGGQDGEAQKTGNGRQPSGRHKPAGQRPSTIEEDDEEPSRTSAESTRDQKEPG